MKKLKVVPAAAKMVAAFGLKVSPSVVDAMTRLPRDQFIPFELQASSYADQALGIGKGQTISQPSLVAIMTNLLNLTGKEKVLEVGTGSGYQAAILAQLAKQVVSIEFDRELAAQAELRLLKMGLDNVSVIVGDGSEGYPLESPYDAIIVTAAAPNITQPLVEQLKVGGRLVIPVGPRHSQELLVVTKTKSGLKTDQWGPVQFVPLLGKYGWQE